MDTTEVCTRGLGTDFFFKEEIERNFFFPRKEMGMNFFLIREELGRKFFSSEGIFLQGRKWEIIVSKGGIFFQGKN